MSSMSVSARSWRTAGLLGVLALLVGCPVALAANVYAPNLSPSGATLQFAVNRYHIIATNSAGTTAGTVGTFTTQGGT